MVLKRPRKVRCRASPVPCRDGGRADPGGAAAASSRPRSGSTDRGRRGLRRRGDRAPSTGPGAFDRLDRLGPGLVGRVPRLRPRAQRRAGPAPAGPVPRRSARSLMPASSGSRPMPRSTGATRRVPGRRARARRAAPSRPRSTRPRSGAGRPELGPWTSSLDPPEFEAGVRTIVEHIEAGDCYQVNLTRRLTCDRAGRSGRALVRAREPATRRRTRRSCAPAPPTSASATSRWSPRRPSASSRVDGPAGRDPSDQGHRDVTGAAAREREGPGRERDDRRPRPQRPRPRVRAGLGAGAGAVRARAAPRARAPREHRARHAARPTSGSAGCCARRSRPRRSPARRSRACCRRSRTSSRCARGVYCGAVGWIDTDRGPRRPRGRDPHVHGDARRRRSSASAAASPPTRTRPRSGTRPSSRPRAS